MINMMLVEDKGEALKVETLFEKVRTELDAGRSFVDADCYSEERQAFTDFRKGGVCIPFGSLVYVYRSIGGGEAVYDVYSFGYKGKFVVETDLEGDLAGLVNSDYFPF